MAGTSNDLTIYLRAQDQASRPLQQVGKSVRDVVSESRGVPAPMGQASKAIDQIGDSAQRSSGLLNSLSTGIAAGVASAVAAIGIGAVGGAITGAITSAMGFEAAMREVNTMIGLNQQEFQALSSATNELAGRMGIDAVGAAKGLYQAISAGVPADNAIKFLEVASMAAIGGVTDLETAVDGITTVMNAFQVQAISAEQAADVMFTVVKNGKCVTGDTRVLLADGRYVRIDSLRGGGTVLAYDGRAFVPMRADWVDQGVKRTVLVRTRLGREISTTWNHPYLSLRADDPAGVRPEWRLVSDLREGDRIAVPTALPYFGDEEVPEWEASLLGLWLAKGSAQGGFRISTSLYGQQVTDWAAEMGCETRQIERREGRCPTYQVVAGPRGYTQSNPALEFLRRYGLEGKSAGDKRLPQQVYTWRRQRVATLLRWLFNGDGWLSTTKTGYQVGFVSKSEGLVRDVSHLLLRFGVVGRVRNRHNCFVWETNRHAEVQRFLTFIGIDRGTTAAAMAHVPAREKARRYGAVEFDPIVLLEERDDEHVYDLVVPELHNFVANDIVAHNTNFEQLSRSMFNVAPLAASLGVRFEEASAAIATLTKQGVPTSVATTQIRAAMQGLIRPSDEMTKIFREAGFESAELALQQIGLQKSLTIVAEATKGNKGELQKLLGSVEAVGAALGITGDMARVFESDMEAMMNATGAAQSAYEEMNNSLSRQMAIIRHTLKSAVIEMGMALIPLLTPLARLVATQLPGILARGTGAMRAFSQAVQLVGTLLRTMDLDEATRAFAGLEARVGRAARPILLVVQTLRALRDEMGLILRTGDLGAAWDGMREAVPELRALEPVVNRALAAYNRLFDLVQRGAAVVQREGRRIVDGFRMIRDLLASGVSPQGLVNMLRFHDALRQIGGNQGVPAVVYWVAALVQGLARLWAEGQRIVGVFRSWQEGPGGLGGIVQLLRDLGPASALAVAAISGFMGLQLLNYTTDAVLGLGRMASNGFDAITSAARGTASAVQGAWDTLTRGPRLIITTIRQVFEQVGKAVDVAGQVWQRITQVLTRVGTSVLDAGTDVVQTVRQQVIRISGPADVVGDALKGVVQGAGAGVGAAIGAIVVKGIAAAIAATGAASIAGALASVVAIALAAVATVAMWGGLWFIGYKLITGMQQAFEEAPDAVGRFVGTLLAELANAAVRLIGGGIELAGAILSGIGQALADAGKLAEAIGEALQQGMADLGSFLGNELLPRLGEIVEAFMRGDFQAVFTLGLNLVKDLFITWPLQLIGNLLGALNRHILQPLLGWMGGLLAMFGEELGKIRDEWVWRAQEIWRGIQEGWLSRVAPETQQALNGMLQAIQGVMGAISGAIGWVVDRFGDLLRIIGQVGDAVRNFDLGRLGQIVTQGPGVLFGGARAQGGPVQAGRAYLVGERGPELFIPGLSGQVIPGGPAAPGLAGGGGARTLTIMGGLHVHVEGGTSPDAMASKAIPALLRELDAAARRYGMTVLAPAGG